MFDTFGRRLGWAVLGMAMLACHGESEPSARLEVDPATGDARTLARSAVPSPSTERAAPASPASPRQAAPVPAPATAPATAPAPGASPSTTLRPRCAPLADDSGWTCSPAAASPEELATLLAGAVALHEDPVGDLVLRAGEVSRPEGALGAEVALFGLDEQNEFGGARAFVALATPAGWGYATSVGTIMFGVNSGAAVTLAGAHRDEGSGMLVVETTWSGDDAACTEPLSWRMTERRATVCALGRAACRTVPVAGEIVESRYGEQEDDVRSTVTARFEGQLVLDERGHVQVRRVAGRAGRDVRRLARPTGLEAIPPSFPLFQI